MASAYTNISKFMYFPLHKNLPIYFILVFFQIHFLKSLCAPERFKFLLF